MPENPYAPGETAVAKPQLQYWFLAGFLLVLITMALTVTSYTFTPSGSGIMACKLWKYYQIELSRAFSGNRALGPTSGSTNAAMIVAIEHLLISATGGLIAVGIGWAVGKYRRKKTA
jgi:hypothetical protein